MSTYDDIVPRASEKKKTPVSITDPAYKHSIVDSSKRPLETIISFIGGSNWYIDFYSQILRDNEELKPFDRSSHTAYQTYRCIHRLQVKLQGGLTSNDNQDTGRLSQSGTMIIAPLLGLTPNVYDMFIADIGEGVAGLFTITNINKLSLNAQAAFECNFELSVTMNQGLEQKLNHKTMEHLHYDHDLLMVGENPIIVREEYHAMSELRDLEKSITQLWLSESYSHETKTLLVPGQPKPTYDQYVVKAMVSLVSGSHHSNYGEVRQYNVDDHRMDKHTDIYSVIATGEKHFLAHCFRKFLVVDKRVLQVSPYQNSVKYSAIERIVVPGSSRIDADNYGWVSNIPQGAKFAITGTKTTKGDKGSKNQCVPCIADVNIPCGNDPLAPNNGSNGGDIKDTGIDYSGLNDPGMDIPRIGSDSYVLSKAFYDNTPSECTLFEREILGIMCRKKANWQTALSFSTAYPKWGRLERYYLAPLLICIIRSALYGKI